MYHRNKTRDWPRKLTDEEMKKVMTCACMKFKKQAEGNL